MPASEVPSVGQRIREERLKRDLSLRSLAREVGVSASLISQIENERSQPSVSTLYAITSALGISIQDVFDRAELPAAAGARAVGETGPPSTVLDALGSYRGSRLGPHVRPSQRQVIKLDSGVTWERLGALPHLAVDFLLVTYDPGGTSSSNDGLMRHQGCEFGYLLSGELVLTLGFEDFVLRPGDALSFDSTTPHRYRNVGTEPAVGVWFVTDQHH
jgi:DNA-binding XRE family transcriptional regulator/quercetin dioxygenase-like cupin family protein